MPGTKRTKKGRVDATVAEARVDEILRLRLEGFERRRILQFISQEEKRQGSNWVLGPGEDPMTSRMVHVYISRADALIQSSHEKSRKVLLRRHLAQRRHLYAVALAAGENRTALACLRDEAELIGLYPADKVVHTGTGGRPIEFIVLPTKEEPCQITNPSPTSSDAP
jgi:hypothetical protein